MSITLGCEMSRVPVIFLLAQPEQILNPLLFFSMPRLLTQALRRSVLPRVQALTRGFRVSSVFSILAFGAPPLWHPQEWTMHSMGAPGLPGKNMFSKAGGKE